MRNPTITTDPMEQLQILCDALGDPNLPAQKLNRLLICRQAWNKTKGLPPSARRALDSLVPFAERKRAATESLADPVPDEVIAGQETAEQARAILASGEKLHHATKARLTRIAEGTNG